MTVYRTLPGISTPPKIIHLPGQSMADVGIGDADGQKLKVRITGAAGFELALTWFADLGEWRSKPIVIMRTDDAWALDWTRQPMADMKSDWRRASGGVGWYREPARAYLHADTAAGDATVHLESFSNAVADMPAAGQALIRDRLIHWTGKNDIAAGQVDLTGVTWDNASAITYPAQYTPVIPWALATIGGGDPGGSGTTPDTLEHVGDLVASGLVVQEKLTGVMNASYELPQAGVPQPGLPFSVTMFYIHADDADDLGAQANFPSTFNPPTAYMLGPGRVLTSTTDHLQGFTGNGHRDDERGFKERIADWQDTTLAFTKSRVRPVIYGTMSTVNPDKTLTPTAAKDTGEAYQLTGSWCFRYHP